MKSIVYVPVGVTLSKTLINIRIIEFFEEFPDEQTFKLHFKGEREKLGVLCKNYKNTKHYWIKAKWQWQCAKCSFRTCLRSGKIMHKTKINFQTFYMCMAFITSTKKGMSFTKKTIQHLIISLK